MNNFYVDDLKSCPVISFGYITENIYRFSTKLLLTLFFVLLGIQNLLSADYYQCQSGSWNDPKTWSTTAGYDPPVNTGTYPKAGDNVYIANNGRLATITLTADAECANLYFEGSEPACVIAMGDYNLVLSGTWTTNWSSNVSISQGSGYLQINGGIPQFFTAKTIANLRVGSATFNFNQTNTIELTVTSNYDYFCYQSSVPTGINASSAAKHHATPCIPELTASTLPDFGAVCTGSAAEPKSFTISGYGLNSSDINIAALTGFSYSNTIDGTFTNTLSLSQSGGNYSKTVYVKFNPTNSVAYNGNITVSGGGASAITVGATGSGANSVSPVINSPAYSNITLSTVTLGATITLASCASEAVTERGFYISTTNGFANGTGRLISETGNFGTGKFNIAVSDLAPSTTYYFKAFATNSSGTSYSAQGSFNNSPITYYSRQSGDWANPSTWTTSTEWGSATNIGTFPQGADNVVIRQQHEVTINAAGLSCYNIDMSAHATRLILNNHFTIRGNLLLTSQGYISAGAYNLTIEENFTNTPNEYNSRIDYSSGNVSIGGNINVAKNGYEPFNCSGSGWLVLSGISRTFTSNSDLTLPNIRIDDGKSATLAANITSNTLTINPGANLAVNAGKQLTIGGTFTNNGTFNLLSDATCSVATVLTNGTTNGNGTYKIQQYLQSIRNWYMSTPLLDAKAPAGFTIFSYLEPGNNTNYTLPATAYWKSIATGTDLSPSTGYIVQPNSGASTFEFVGSGINNGNKTFALSRTAGKSKEGFNLVGNPYPSYVNWDATQKTNIETTVWFRTKNLAGQYVYDTYNGIGTNNNQAGAVTAMIPPMQGFWVKVASGKTNGTLGFTNSTRSHQTNAHRLKTKSAASKNILRLQVSNSVNSDEAILVFNTESSDSLDNYDAPKMSNNNLDIPEIYTFVGDVNLTINSLNSVNPTTEIPLGFSTGKAGMFTIAAIETIGLSENYSILLKDKHENVEFNLNSVNPYTFFSNSETTNSRFSLIFKTKDTSTGNQTIENGENAWFIYTNEARKITVRSVFENPNFSISISNVAGQIIYKKTVHATMTEIDNINSGIYTLVISDGVRTVNKKLIVK